MMWKPIESSSGNSRARREGRSDAKPVELFLDFDPVFPGWPPERAHGSRSRPDAGEPKTPGMSVPEPARDLNP
jgi:hypothetical protein